MKTRPWITAVELDNPTSIDADEAIQAASFILFALSGQRYAGVQEITEQYFCESSGAPVGCLWDPGTKRWFNSTLGFYAYLGTIPTSRSNALLPGSRIRLTHRPVRSITSITIGGGLVDPTSYSTLDGDIVVRSGSWGMCDSPVITYQYGVAPPALGRMAARQLANELVLAAAGSDQCALPSNVRSVSRQGMSFEIFDPQDFMDKGHTGLYVVDMFLAAANPSKAKKRAKVFSPDMPRGYRQS